GAEPAAAPEEGVGAAPARRGYEPRRQWAAADVSEIEPEEDEGQGKTATLLEPVRDRRRAEKVEARHAQSAEHPDEEIELPQRADDRDEGEAGTGQDGGRNEQDAGLVPVREGADPEA